MTVSIDSLPTEILLRIFSGAVCSCADVRKFYHGPILNLSSPFLLTGVCKKWRQITSTNRLLWTHVDVPVNTKEDHISYPTPRHWVERSLGSPLHLCIQEFRLTQPGFFDEDHEDIDRVFGETARLPTPAIRKLQQFITPLMPHVSSVTLYASSPNNALLSMLLNCWKHHGIHGSAKTLAIYVNPELSHVNVRASAMCDFFESLEVLRLYNTVLPWPGSRFHDLIDLGIEVGEGEWSTDKRALASLLASCPKIERLSLVNIHVKGLSEPNPAPASLPNLKTLRVGHSTSDHMLEAMISIIGPGPNPLRLHVNLSCIRKRLEPALASLRLFLQRSNVKVLHVRGRSMNGSVVPYFASQIGPLPGVQALILEHVYFYEEININASIFRDSSESEDGFDHPSIVTYINLSPIDSHPPLWPQLESLYLHHCYIDKGYIRRILSTHPAQNLFMRNCYNNLMAQTYHQAFDKRGALGEEFVQSLSPIVPRVVLFDKGWGEWPLLEDQT